MLNRLITRPLSPILAPYFLIRYTAPTDIVVNPTNTIRILLFKAPKNNSPDPNTRPIAPYFFLVIGSPPS